MYNFNLIFSITFYVGNNDTKTLDVPQLFLHNKFLDVKLLGQEGTKDSIALNSYYKIVFQRCYVSSLGNEHFIMS